MSAEAGPIFDLPNGRKGVRIEGLPMCCIRTLLNYKGGERTGTVLPCNRCQQTMIARNDAWELKREV